MKHSGQYDPKQAAAHEYLLGVALRTQYTLSNMCSLAYGSYIMVTGHHWSCYSWRYTGRCIQDWGHSRHTGQHHPLQAV